ncbi:osmotically-inducible lipoprotein OsmE [Pseudomonas sp. 2FG]|uniref:osmotically-inducible lipoprotein OsmE n=1 Tax=Pseudomonas sp. 2FG TaxID=2502191 RepID=UPI0010F62BF8|nr:osmotically-inducible lipoprotein OsmE [Pseudomonas sp. 2FG]
MYKQTLAAVSVLTALAGCASKYENPIDYLTYRDEPLVKNVEKDMSKQEVLGIGGQPSAERARTVNPGSCNDYILNVDGHQQPYHVSFDSAGRVDHKGYMSCQDMENNERARERPVHEGGY